MPKATVSFEELSQHFHKPLAQVSSELSICMTMIKKICRQNNVPRWPHRKVPPSGLSNPVLHLSPPIAVP